MMWTKNSAVCLLLVAAAAAVPQQQRRPPSQPQQGNRQQPSTGTGDIDSIAPDRSFVSLDPAAIQRFLNNEKSVNTLTRCYINRAQCTSASSLNLMGQIAAAQASGGQCNGCDPAAQQKMEQLMGMLIKGLSDRYPQQWQYILPNIRPLVQALQQKG